MAKIQVTEDGSHTLFSDMAGQTYHSSHGAIQESRHIFISQLLIKSQQLMVDSQRSMVNGQQVRVDGFGDEGLSCGVAVGQGEDLEVLSVLEIGFGTGLNAVLAAEWARKNGVRVEFTTIELYPLEREVYSELNYGRLLGCEELFLQLHEAKWDAGLQRINGNFAIRKCRCDIVEWLENEECGMRNEELFGLSDCSCKSFNSQLSTFNSQYDVVFFDAFSPDVQPELWTEGVFKCVYALMKEGGVMTTYCAKGDVRRAMLAAGFRVEKLQGPPGKRHILRAVKE